VVVSLLNEPAALLDVGGTPGVLRRFLKRTAVTTANIHPPADVVLSGTSLPFADRSFDAATSIDVLEHLARDERQAHLQELVRVSRGQVVACCPLGTPKHVEAERELAARYPHPFLMEHLAKGLPTEEELRSLVSGLDVEVKLWFHGDFRASNELFALEREVRALRPGAVLAYAARRARWRPDARLARASTPYTNRVFLVA